MISVIEWTYNGNNTALFVNLFFSKHFYFSALGITDFQLYQFHMMQGIITNLLLFMELTTGLESCFNIFYQCYQGQCLRLNFLLARTSFNKANEFLLFKFREALRTKAPLLHDFLEPLNSECAVIFPGSDEVRHVFIFR